MQVDSTPGPVLIVVLHRIAGEAREIAEDQLVRAAAGRATGPGDRWMTGMRAPVTADPVRLHRSADPAPVAPATPATPPRRTPPQPIAAAAIPEFGQGSP